MPTRIEALLMLRHVANRFSVPPVVAVAFGTVGGWIIVLASSEIGAVPRPLNYHWWLRVTIGSALVAHLLVYLGVGILVASWWALGLANNRAWLTGTRFWATLLLWSAPFFLGVPVFSRDVYSYVAQGLVVHAGLNPYVASPAAISHGPILQSVATVWQHTASPYGPLLNLLGRLAASIDTHSLFGQIFVYRTLALIGLVALALVVAPMARHRGASPETARWLITLSPLSLISIISSAHNDVFMLLLLSAGIVALDRHHRLWAVVLITLAATIKLPALAGIAFLGISDLSVGSLRERALRLAQAVVACAGTIALVTAADGNRWTWLTPRALRIPASLHVLTTPSVFLSAFLGGLSRHSSTTFLSAVQLGCGVVAVFAVGYLLWAYRQSDLVGPLGLALLIVVVLSPTIWPWYFVWGISLLATTRVQDRVTWAVLAAGAMFLVGPGGTPLLGQESYWVTTPLFIVAAVYYLRPAYRRELLEAL